MDKGGIILILSVIALVTIVMLIAVPAMGMALLALDGIAAVIGLGIYIIEQIEKDATKRRSSHY